MADLMLRDKLGDRVSFTLPQGGMAIWLRFKETYPLDRILNRAKERELYLKGSAYYKNHHSDLNSLRFSFASLNKSEMHSAVSILQDVLERG